MSNTKQQVQKILEELSDDVTLEDIQYHIYVREKVEAGLRDVEDGNVVDQKEAEQRMSRYTHVSFMGCELSRSV